MHCIFPLTQTTRDRVIAITTYSIYLSSGRTLRGVQQYRPVTVTGTGTTASHQISNPTSTPPRAGDASHRPLSFYGHGVDPYRFVLPLTRPEARHPSAQDEERGCLQAKHGRDEHFPGLGKQPLNPDQLSDEGFLVRQAGVRAFASPRGRYARRTPQSWQVGQASGGSEGTKARSFGEGASIPNPGKAEPSERMRELSSRAFNRPDRRWPTEGSPGQ